MSLRGASFSLCQLPGLMFITMTEAHLHGGYLPWSRAFVENFATRPEIESANCRVK